MKNKIKQHKQQYWHIPKFKIGLFFLFLLVLTITIFWIYLSITKLGLFEIFSLEPEEVTINNFILNLFFNYFLISLTFICLVAWIKNGFKNLKSFEDTGLIWGLIGGLIWGLIGGLIKEFEK